MNGHGPTGRHAELATDRAQAGYSVRTTVRRFLLPTPALRRMSLISATAISDLAPLILESVELVRETLRREAPSVVETEEGFKLQEPDRRMASGVAKEKGKPVTTLLVEKEDSWALQKAKDMQESMPRPTTVTVTGTAHSWWPQDRLPPTKSDKLKPGLSISHFRGHAGTLGCLVTWGGRVALAGASHVLAINNSAKRGDPVLIPGYPDGSRRMANRIGTVADYIYLVHHQDEDRFDAHSVNTEDIAVVALDQPERCPSANLVPNPKDPDRRIRQKGDVPVEELVERIAEPFFKLGRTSSPLFLTSPRA